MVWLLVAYVLEMRYTTPHLEVLATYHQVKLDLALPVQLTDSNSSSRLRSQINELLNRRDAVALFVYCTTKELCCCIVRMYTKY